jgi:eukaryotic-like serine/threonine-protein kinase
MSSRYGRYEVLYKLGHGAMAEVHLARDPMLNRFVAIKVLHAELATRKDVLQRFFNEARTVAVVRNPHVVEVFDFGQQDDELYLVMEFVDGQSLHGILKQLQASPNRSGNSKSDEFGGQLSNHYLESEPLDIRVSAALICQAAEGLSVAAQHGVVHRDLKPENMLINQQGYLKISDFGIAHVQNDSLTKTGAILGSPLFMSPEQSLGLKPITFQSDIFSLGAVFYSCLAGHPPFQGKSFVELSRKITRQPHIPLIQLRPELDPALAGLVETLLQKRPNQRGGGPKWLHHQLKSYLMSEGISDSAEMVGEYLKQLSARGVQTTWASDGPRTIAATRVKTLRFSREVKQKRSLVVPALILFTLVMVGSGIWVLLGPKKSILNAHVKPLEASGQAVVPEALKVEPSPTQAKEADQNSTLQTPLLGSNQVKPIQAPVTEGNVNLLLQSSPPFAETFVDGRYVGLTPVEVNLLSVGTHRITMKNKNLQALDTLLEFRPGTQTIKFKIVSGLPGQLAGSEGEGL